MNPTNGKKVYVMSSRSNSSAEDIIEGLHGLDFSSHVNHSFRSTGTIPQQQQQQDASSKSRNPSGDDGSEPAEFDFVGIIDPTPEVYDTHATTELFMKDYICLNEYMKQNPEFQKRYNVHIFIFIMY